MPYINHLNLTYNKMVNRLETIATEDKTTVGVTKTQDSENLKKQRFYDNVTLGVAVAIGTAAVASLALYAGYASTALNSLNIFFK